MKKLAYNASLEALRSKEHRRNNKLDKLLGELSDLLSPVENGIIGNTKMPRYPVLFLVGNPRSGTTAFTQFIQSTQQFYVPTNVISRFYYAPYIGAKIEQLLFHPEFDFRGELTGHNASSAVVSSLGKTMGPLAASEFLHFWRRFVPCYEPQFINPDSQGKIDTDSIATELAAVESVFSKPLALKGSMLLLNLLQLQKCARESLFIYLRRDPLFIAQSILLGRENHYGRRDIWWSVMPKEYSHLESMDVFHQVAGQVFYIKQSIESDLSVVSDENKLVIDYESFCDNPQKVYSEIAMRYEKLGYPMPLEYVGSHNFKCSNEIRIDCSDFERLKSAYEDFVEGRVVCDMTY
jgi:hypothetical protein